MFVAGRRRSLPPVIIAAASLLLGLGAPGAALARKAARGWKPAVRGKAPAAAVPAAKAAGASAGSDADAGHAAGTPNQHGKVVLFPFRDDPDDQMSKHVGHILKTRGLDVMTGVRPVDSAEQYRDMATHLMLAAYVDGSVRDTGRKAKVTVRLRSGYSGRVVAQPSFVESPGNLRHELGEKLWKRLGPAVARSCKDADKPRKRSKTTLTIDAGTPIETTPREPRDPREVVAAPVPPPAPKPAATAAATAPPAATAATPAPASTLPLAPKTKPSTTTTASASSPAPKTKQASASASTWVDPFAQ